MLHVLPPLLKPANNLICCKTGLMWVVKRATSLYSTRFAAKLQNRLHVFCCPFFRTLSHAFAFSDLDECTSSPPVCDLNADCTNTRGSYLCTCKAGFSGDGKTCYRKGKFLLSFSVKFGGGRRGGGVGGWGAGVVDYNFCLFFANYKVSS